MMFETDQRQKELREGFTLVELLLAIAIIGVLAAIVVTAINPGKQLADARDAQRRSDVNAIANGVWQYQIDHDGDLPCDANGNCLDESPRMVGTIDRGCDGAVVCPTAASVSESCFDPVGLVGTYLPAMPVDPRYGSGAKTYYVVRSYGPPDNHVIVTSCLPEQGTGITFPR